MPRLPLPPKRILFCPAITGADGIVVNNPYRLSRIAPATVRRRLGATIERSFSSIGRDGTVREDPSNPVPPLHSAHSEIASAVIGANAAFYEAFATRDMAAMEQLWAVKAPVACVHPGWDILTGRERVIESWRRILLQASAPEIAHRNAHPMIHGTCVLVSCQELLSGITLAAVNTFVYESNGWRMVMHQASQIAQPTPRHDVPPTGAVH